MIISTKKGTPKEELEKIVDKFEKQGLNVTLITGKDYNVFGLVGDTTKIDERDVLANPWIDNVTRVSAPYKRANRLFHPADSVIDCGGVKIGSKEKIAVMAGPCSIENAEQALRIAQGVKAGGATLFRGGAYKPRTSPYAFQGLETEGILDMVKAREATGLPIVSELMSEDRIPEFEEYVDVVQIGARNMQNFQLLKAVGKMHKPVLLKRGLCNTIEEWIMSAEYIMAGGNEQVIFCCRSRRCGWSGGRGALRPPARMERRRTVPDPGRLCTGYGQVPSGGLGYRPGDVNRLPPQALARQLPQGGA